MRPYGERHRSGCHDKDRCAICAGNERVNGERMRRVQRKRARRARRLECADAARAVATVGAGPECRDAVEAP